MKRSFLPVLIGSSLLSIGIPSPLFSSIGRDSEAFYLDQAPGINSITLEVLKLAAVFGDRQKSFHTQNALKGSKVCLLAYHPEAYFVESTQPRFTGWMDPKDLSKVSEETVRSITKEIAQQKKYQQAIADKTVLPGMNFEQVLKALGKPNGKSFRVDASGRTDLWSYIVYERKIEYQPGSDRFGNPVTIPVTIQVPVGSLDVEFVDGKVTAYQQQTTDDSRSSKVKIKSS